MSQISSYFYIRIGEVKRRGKQWQTMTLSRLPEKEKGGRNSLRSLVKTCNSLGLSSLYVHLLSSRFEKDEGTLCIYSNSREVLVFIFMFVGPILDDRLKEKFLKP